MPWPLPRQRAETQRGPGPPGRFPAGLRPGRQLHSRGIRFHRGSRESLPNAAELACWRGSHSRGWWTALSALSPSPVSSCRNGHRTSQCPRPCPPDPHQHIGARARTLSPGSVRPPQGSHGRSLCSGAGGGAPSRFCARSRPARVSAPTGITEPGWEVTGLPAQLCPLLGAVSIQHAGASSAQLWAGSLLPGGGRGETPPPHPCAWDCLHAAQGALETGLRRGDGPGDVGGPSMHSTGRGRSEHRREKASGAGGRGQGAALGKGQQAEDCRRLPETGRTRQRGPPYGPQEEPAAPTPGPQPRD